MLCSGQNENGRLDVSRPEVFVVESKPPCELDLICPLLGTSSRTVGTPRRISASFPCRRTFRIRQRKHHTHLRKHHRFGGRRVSFLPAVLHRGCRSGCIRNRDVCIQPSWRGRRLNIHLHMQRRRGHIADTLQYIDPPRSLSLLWPL